MFYTWREDGEEGKVRCIEGGCPAITGYIYMAYGYTIYGLFSEHTPGHCLM
jgi:hypothetical protein